MTEAATRTCPRCSTLNERETEVCVSCGLQFDTLGHIAAREQLRFDDRFTRRAQDVAEVKATEQTQSAQRLDQMWTVEQQRQTALAAQRATQRQQERRLMSMALALLIIAVVTVIVVLILSARG